MGNAENSRPGLSRHVHHVGAVEWGDATVFAGGTLTVDRDEAANLLADPALADVRLSWASPGQSVRVVKVLDAVEPRSKGEGGGGIFPGFVGPPKPQGTGTTHVLRGAAVVAAGYLPRAQEALFDLSGPAQELSPLGSVHNLVVEFTPAEEPDWGAVDVALRRGMLRLAARLAEAAVDVDADEVEEVPASAATANGLPRVGAITNLQTQGTFKDVFVYGRRFADALATFIEAGDLDDGAVVSGQFGHPALKNPTYVHQNNPVAEALRRRHGHDLSFAGVVLCPEPVEAAQKDLVSAHAARLCAASGWDAAIVTKEGGGNADADVALKMDALEDAGITAIGLLNEMSGPDGTGPPIVVAPERAAALVSTGNYDHRMTLPAVDTALGGDDIALLKVPATEEVTLPVAVVYASCSPLGWGRLKGVPS